MIPLLVAGCAERNLFRPQLPQEPPPFSDTGTEPTPDRWWTTFGDANLDYHINLALGSNYSLASAQQRVSAARALARREASDLCPDINGVADVSRTWRPGRDITAYEWGLDSSYTVDLWGEIESRVDAARLRADATALDYHAIALTLAAEISGTWFSLIEAHAQVELLDQQIDTNRKGLQVQESRFGQGLIRIADVLRQRQLLESTLEQSVVAKSRVEVLEHQLAVLLGEMPQTAGYEPGAQLPQLPPLPSTGLPLDLLRRRPDIRRDFAAFQAADKDLASAISAQYPRLSLSGSLLNAGTTPESVLRDWFLSIGEQLVAPLFDGGQRRAEVDRTSAVSAELFYEYAQTTLAALAEVEDSLAQEKYQLERIRHLENQVRLAGESSDRLREQYQIGDVDFLDVLSAITGQQSLQRQALAAQLELVLIRVTLYRALAGDFDTRPQSFPPPLIVVPDEVTSVDEPTESDTAPEESEETMDPDDSDATEERLPEPEVDSDE